MPVIAHISGPSGSGKTTIGQQLKQLCPSLVIQDLDEMDDIAHAELFGNRSKEKFTDNDITMLAARRQQLLDSFIKKNNDKQIVLVGHHTEGNTVLNIHTDNKLMLNTPPITSAYRAYLRSQNEKPGHRRTLAEIPEDVKEAKTIVDQLTELGYLKFSPEDIITLISSEVAT